MTPLIDLKTIDTVTGMIEKAGDREASRDQLGTIMVWLSMTGLTYHIDEGAADCLAGSGASEELVQAIDTIMTKLGRQLGMAALWEAVETCWPSPNCDDQTVSAWPAENDEVRVRSAPSESGARKAALLAGLGEMGALVSRTEQGIAGESDHYSIEYVFQTDGSSVADVTPRPVSRVRFDTGARAW